MCKNVKNDLKHNGRTRGFGRTIWKTSVLKCCFMRKKAKIKRGKVVDQTMKINNR